MGRIPELYIARSRLDYFTSDYFDVYHDVFYCLDIDGTLSTNTLENDAEKDKTWYKYTYLQVIFENSERKKQTIVIVNTKLI